MIGSRTISHRIYQQKVWERMRTLSGSPVNVDDPVVAVNLSQTYRYGMSAEELYDCTRGIWRLSKGRAEGAKYAFAVYRGVIIEVYEVDQWLSAGTTKYRWRQFTHAHLQGRYEFVGKVAPDAIREKYVDQLMPVPHGQNPVRYLNC
jgi:hypothetical protein